ncbi:DUF6475 domain-containing protein [Alcaligenes sp. YSL9]|uniref:DUF6475 domain-containing protein n=1 Tax=Alcaligenes sp. YSL9 TaxID=2939596 RepID=UPI00266D7CB6|nr:DUF6475 domain-containing protein [Alcaligenes sp. YSL9]
MQQADFEQFSQMLNAAADLYGKTMSGMAISLWWNALSQYDLSAVRDGLSRHMQSPDSGQFMPKPADVIRMIGGTTQDGALQAWAKVNTAVRSVGTYQTVAFDDPIIHAVVTDMGGWVALGAKTEHEWPFVATEFENRYRGYRNRGGADEYPRTLIGIAEAQNSQNGIPSQPPVLIGDAGRAKQVLLGGSDSRRIGFQQLGEQELGAVMIEAEPRRLQA